MPLVVDPAFRSVKDKPDGTCIWRIEKMQVVPLDKKKYGQFHSGDSYILLYKNKRAGEYNVHFWLGKETSRDEAGTAAIKSVELDDCLGGTPVQYREVQEHESKKFLSYFKSGIQYMEGGVATGFKKVEKENIQRLLQVKGGFNPRVFTVPCAVSSMNEGDCFILDIGAELMMWSGKQASRREKIKAAEVMRQIRDDERAGRGALFFIESGEDSPSALKFFENVGNADEVKDAKDGGSDKAAENAPVGLYRVTDSGGDGKVVMSKVSNAPLEQKMLDTKDCFILDTGASGVFVWVGKQATRDERGSSMVKAEGFLAAKGHADWTPITRVIEGAETPLFKSAFAKWNYELPKSPVATSARGSSREVKTFDVKSMHVSQRSEVSHMPDDARGSVQIWRVEDYELVDWPKSRYGIFFQGDSYVILYTYGKQNDKYIIYYWLGLESTQDEQGAAALLSTKLDDKFGGEPVQQRVVQGQEPEHFLRMLKGKMIVKRGGRSKGATTVNEAEEQGGNVHLYKVRGTNEWNVRCIQVDLTATSLNSNDAFILVTARGSFVWCGKRASGDEREYAKAATQMISESAKRYELVMEGQEPQAFWDALGGKKEYVSAPKEDNTMDVRPPRLFHCSNDKGYFYAEEVFDFTQNDLEEDDVMILDTFKDVFLWLGKDCNAVEKKEGLLTLQKYVESSNDGRPAGRVNMLVVKQGHEPIGFTSWFPSWSAEKAAQGKSFEQLKQELSAGGGVTSVDDALKVYNKKYSLAELQENPPPEGVDPCHKERYLHESEFESVFKITIEAFNKLSTWKQGEAKKNVGLF
ncbi:scinderin isoform 2 [Paramuricea clavata]|uniref:Scinderin isoform 2 n=1 Tax=Paramuricea clavata TaxID=317549 RepID=A0A7D9DIV5_PARCT|nr:scinderin isoform 2 [Paramuricea clavata]